MGNIKWSLELAASKAKIAMWTALIKAQSNQQASSQLICHLMKKAGVTSAQGLDLSMAQRNLKQEMKNYYIIQCMAMTCRDNFMEALATAQAKACNRDAAKQLTAL